MVILFSVATPRSVVGSVLSQVDCANALQRRGHAVHIALAAASGHDGRPISSLDEVPWIRLDEGIDVHLVGRSTTSPESPDIVIGLSLPGCLTVGFCRGISDERGLNHPWPIVCVSRAVREHAASLGVPEHRLVYIPNGLDHSTFRVTTPVRDRRPRIAMLYHPGPGKRVVDGLETLAALRQRRPDVRAVLFGARDPVHEIPDWITYQRLPDQRTLVEEIYNGSSVFLCPSISEGFGRPSIEAMASGCALVTVDNGGSRDFAIHDRTALVTPPQDVRAMTAATEHLLDNHDYRTTIAEQGVEYSRNFDWDVTAARLEHFLHAYLADPERYVDDDALPQVKEATRRSRERSSRRTQAPSAQSTAAP